MLLNVLIEDSLKVVRRVMAALFWSAAPPELDVDALPYDVLESHPLRKGRLKRIHVKSEFPGTRENEKCKCAYLFQPYLRGGKQPLAIFFLAYEAESNRKGVTHLLLIIEAPHNWVNGDIEINFAFRGYYDLQGFQRYPNKFVQPILFKLASFVSDRWGESEIDTDWLIDNIRQEVMGFAWPKERAKQEEKIIYVQAYDPGTKDGVIRVKGNNENR